MRFWLRSRFWLALGVPLLNAEGQTAGAAEAPVKMQWIEHEFLMPCRACAAGIDVLQVECTAS